MGRWGMASWTFVFLVCLPAACFLIPGVDYTARAMAVGAMLGGLLGLAMGWGGGIDHAIENWDWRRREFWYNNPGRHWRADLGKMVRRPDDN